MDTAKLGYYVLRHGVKSIAEITRITNTNTEHNERTIKEYNFRYEVNGKMFNHEYQSAYKRHLQEGERLTIFYDPKNPKLCFIPSLYNLTIY